MGKRKNKLILIVLLGILVILFSADVFAAENSKQANMSGLHKMQAGTVTQSMVNIGNWGFWANYTGQTGHDPFTGGSGGYYPRGTAAAIYMDGIIWGGILRGASKIPLRVGGIGYRIGTDPGWITSPGDGTMDATTGYLNGATAIGSNNDRARMYRIRADWRTLSSAMVKKDAAELNNIAEAAVSDAQAQEVVEQYKADWLNWPTDLGAPYYDVNGNGVYDPVLDANGYADETAGDYPGIANADQVLWYVVNDLNPTKVFSHSGSPPMGLELQTTLWGYNQPGAGLGQIVFKKYKLINYSGYYIDSMFVAQYSDPDMGNAGDDLVGCDVEKSLHYVYNGGPVDVDYAGFGFPPPSAGYDFFQGPLVKTDDMADTAVFNLKNRIGYKNLPMTSFGYFAAGSDISDPDMGDYTEFTHSWYNMLNGYIPTTDLVDPTPYKHGSGPNAGQPTKFPLDGDPVGDPTGASSDVDGQGSGLAAGDRRMFACSGPFTMAPGDTQEVVVALVAEMGSDYKSSITAMLEIDVLSQKLYDDLFATVPKPPAGPKATASNLDDTIILNWGSDLAAVAATESDNPLTGYNFQGYNVYQLPSANASLDQGVRLATYDKVDSVDVIMGRRFVSRYGQVVEVPVQYGANSGLKRYFHVNRNAITGDPLRQGTIYYFAVTAYNYNEAPKLIEDKALESGAVVLSVTHQGPKPGDRYESDAAEVLEITHTTGISDGLVEVTVVDPTVTTGHDYEVYFYVDEDTNSATVGETLWGVRDVTAAKVLLDGQQQAADLSSNDQLIFDGLQIKVSGPVAGINLNIPGPYGVYPGHMGYGVTGGTRWVSWPTNWGLETMGGSLGNGSSFFGSDVVATDYVNVEVRFAGCTDRSDSTSEGLMAASKAEFPDRWQKAVVYHRPTYAPQSVLGDIPMTVWDTENNRQLKVAFVEEPRLDGSGVPLGNANLIWDMGWNGSDFKAYGGREYFFIINDTYDEDYTEYLNGNLDGTYNGALYASGWGKRSQPYLNSAFEIQIFASHVNTPADKFAFKAPSVTQDIELAKSDVKKINVFPNPYYGSNSLETSRFARFVTFNHLPQKATIRIFNLAGVQVRTWEKDSPEQFERWDLLNESGLPVASGMYIAYIDMPELDATKVLKVMIIQSDQVLEYY